MLMRHRDTTVHVLGGMVRVQLPNGEIALVTWDELTPIENLEDKGATEGDQYVKVVYDPHKPEFSVEANGVWPDDVVPFLLDALKVMVREGQQKQK